LGAGLISELRRTHPDARFVGIGGAGMRGAGMDCWWDSEELAVFGLFEVLSHFPRLLRIRRHLRRRLRKLAPDVFIGIDAPDFNLGLEKQLKSSGIPTVHYVSPTVWAWRAWRVRKISRAADLVLCLFPFEPAFYRQRGLAAVYVGHPMADQIPVHNEKAEARRLLGLETDKAVIALLPGSRAGEVSRMSAPMIEAASILSGKYPGIEFVAAIANPNAGRIFGQVLGDRGRPAIRLSQGKARTVIAAADVVVCASGTVTLEAMLINRPVVVAYRLSEATYALVKGLSLVKSRFIGLPNILADEALVPELIQHEATGERIAQEASRWLEDEPSRVELSKRFEALHQKLCSDAGGRAAKAVSGMLQAPP